MTEILLNNTVYHKITVKTNNPFVFAGVVKHVRMIGISCTSVFNEDEPSEITMFLTKDEIEQVRIICDNLDLHYASKYKALQERIEFLKKHFDSVHVCLCKSISGNQEDRVKLDCVMKAGEAELICFYLLCNSDGDMPWSYIWTKVNARTVYDSKYWLMQLREMYMMTDKTMDELSDMVDVCMKRGKECLEAIKDRMDEEKQMEDSNKPTQKQLDFITDIEEFVPEKFHGTTMEEASAYISRNIDLFKLQSMSQWAAEYM